MWPNDISFVADNVIFKNRAQIIECSFDCVARSAVLLKPNVANILLFSFCEQKFVPQGPITIAITVGLSLLIFKEKRPNYTSGPKSAPNSDSFWVRRLFNVCVLQFCLFTYLPRSKWASSEKIIFFFAKIGIFCMSIAGPISEAYTEPYSFDVRIKLIICQIGQELSVTIHELSTSSKKKR